MHQEIKDRIRQYVLTTALPGELSSNLRDDTPLCTSGILDSLATLGLFSFLEEQFSIQISERERSVDTCNRIDHLAQLVARKRQTPAAMAP